MKIKLILPIAFLTLKSLILQSQDVFKTQRAAWLQKSEALKPKLTQTKVMPVHAITTKPDRGAFQGWRVDRKWPTDSLFTKSFKTQTGLILDFGQHITGYFTMKLDEIRGVADAPTRIKLTFGEVPSEVSVPFEPYKGDLSRAWLQDEIITISEMPSEFTLARRVSFRYVKLELLGSSRFFDFRIADAWCTAGTSASAIPPPLEPATYEAFAKIDSIARNTLKECMQTVFEDGPKRDRRLWIGDLYLQSITNNYTFKNHNLTKRCLYLLAGLSTEAGYLPSNVFERPSPHSQKGAPFLFEYSLLYNATLLEYLKATNDRTTALELWPVAKKQLDNPKKFMLDNGLFNDTAAAANRWWLFIDWKEGLDKQAPLQGLIIFALNQTMELAKLLGKQNEVAEIPAMIEKMKKACKDLLYDKEQGLFVSGAGKQVSYATQAWMVLAGVTDTAESQKILTYVKEHTSAVKPGGPYLMHYYVEALMRSGLTGAARQQILSYWGNMVIKGADTFWEVYDPENDYTSPYKFYPVNSYCHAWSCTPAYFIRKYPEVFQQ